MTEITAPKSPVTAMIAVCRDRLAALPADATPVQQAAEVMDEVYKAFVYTPGPPIRPARTAETPLPAIQNRTAK